MYLLSRYKKIYHKAVYHDYSNTWKSKCDLVWKIKAEDKNLVLVPPKDYRPCKHCYRNEDTTLIYSEDL